MARLSALLALFVTSFFGQAESNSGCLKYGVTITITGTLRMIDEAGYNHFTVLKVPRPICAAGNPKDTAYPGDNDDHRQTGVSVIQVGVYGSDPPSDSIRARLERLTGHRVVIKGDLFPATTGYHRTAVQLRVESLYPGDSAGQRLLQAPIVESKAKDIDAYDVTVNAGRRLVIKARGISPTVPLLPADQYVPHRMTGGEVVYVSCRGGYERTLISSTEKDSGCIEDLCGFSAFPKKPLIIKFRCTRNP